MPGLDQVELPPEYRESALKLKHAPDWDAKHPKDFREPADGVEPPPEEEVGAEGAAAPVPRGRGYRETGRHLSEEEGRGRFRPPRELRWDSPPMPTYDQVSCPHARSPVSPRCAFSAPLCFCCCSAADSTTQTFAPPYDVGAGLKACSSLGEKAAVGWGAALHEVRAPSELLLLQNCCACVLRLHYIYSPSCSPSCGHTWLRRDRLASAARCSRRTRGSLRRC